MQYILISIAFFLYSIRSILFWTTVWQKSGYALRYMGRSLLETTDTSHLSRWVTPGIFLLLVFSYGTVIFIDTLTVWYYAVVSAVFVVYGLIFLYEILRGTVIKPVFSIKAFCICIAALVVLSFLYMIPLVDTFLWLVVLSVVIPVIVTIFVLLFAFPTELYEDYKLQRAKKILLKNSDIFTIFLVGMSQERTKRSLYTFLTSSYTVVKNTNYPSFLEILQLIDKKVDKQTDICLWTIPATREEIRKMFLLCKPDIVCFVDNPQEMSAKETRRKTKIYEAFFMHLPKKTIVLANEKNEAVLHLAQKAKKKIGWYGMKKTMYGQKTTIYGHGITKNHTLSIRVSFGKVHCSVKSKDNTSRGVAILPAMYIGYKLGIPIKKIQTIQESLQ